jgi:hypothetical protein
VCCAPPLSSLFSMQSLFFPDLVGGPGDVWLLDKVNLGLTFIAPPPLLINNFTLNNFILLEAFASRLFILANEFRVSLRWISSAERAHNFCNKYGHCVYQFNWPLYQLLLPHPLPCLSFLHSTRRLIVPTNNQRLL